MFGHITREKEGPTMKRRLDEMIMNGKLASVIMAGALVFILAGVSAVWADTGHDGKKLETAVATLDKDAGKREGPEVVTERLEKEFGVTASQVESLRDKKLGFGEITIAFSLAQKMPGGITDANINKILTMRQGHPAEGWGEIAKKLGVKPGPVLSKVDKVERASRNELEKAEKNEHEKNGRSSEHREATKAERHDGQGRR
jgi:hypothetical protein